jgi:Tol biopolymer transport system component
MVDGVTREESSDIELHPSVAFSQDSKRLAYVVNNGERAFVIVDGVKGEELEWAGDVTFSPDGRHVAYWGQMDGRLFTVVDGVKGVRYEAAYGSPVFSPDSRRLAFVVGQGLEIWRKVRNVE